jgi:hypothetical protein
VEGPGDISGNLISAGFVSANWPIRVKYLESKKQAGKLEGGLKVEHY